MQLKSVLVPLDFSPHSTRALEYAAELGRQFGSRIHLLHSYHLPLPIGLGDPGAISPSTWDVIRDAGERQLEEAAGKLRQQGIDVHTHLTAESPSSCICDAAKQLGVDLIVMGTRGTTGLQHVLLGSVAERTQRTAPCPVLGLKASDPLPK